MNLQTHPNRRNGQLFSFFSEKFSEPKLAYHIDHPLSPTLAPLPAHRRDTFYDRHLRVPVSYFSAVYHRFSACFTRWPLAASGQNEREIEQDMNFTSLTLRTVNLKQRAAISEKVIPLV